MKKIKSNNVKGIIEIKIINILWKIKKLIE